MSGADREHRDRKVSRTCVLPDHRRIKYTLKRRNGEPHYFVVFRDPADPFRRLERSTREEKVGPAEEAAVQIITEACIPGEVCRNVTWDEAKTRLKAAMVANNNRPATVSDYVDTLDTAQKFFPRTRGPADITVQMAKSFKTDYHATPYTRTKPKEQKVWKGRGRKPIQRPAPTELKRKPRTVDSRLRKLRVVWEKWLLNELVIVTVNPWKAVDPPILDKLTPRVLTPAEINDFFAWLSTRWNGWLFPVLVFTVKSFIGNRITELCSLKSEQLRDGRIIFPPDEAKGRKERKATLPAELYAKLKTIAGQTYLWEAYPQQLRERLEERGSPHWKVLPEFDSERLVGWLQDEIDDYCKAHPKVKRFSAHSFRKTAMTDAWNLGIRIEDAAIAFGCNANTMRKHYLAMEETEVSDRVFEKLAEKRRVG